MKFFSLIETEDVHLAPDKKVIPAEEFSKLVEAEAILDQTRKEEDIYRQKVATECEKLKELGEKAGFEKGLKQWNAQIERLDEEIKSVRKEMESSIVPLALTAVKKIIGRELETRTDTIVDIISTALKAVTQHRKVSIYVSPQDLETVEAARPEIKELFEHVDSLTIASRNDVTEGGCIIETEAGIINAQLESQLDALKAAFQAFFHNHRKGEGS